MCAATLMRSHCVLAAVIYSTSFICIKEISVWILKLCPIYFQPLTAVCWAWGVCVLVWQGACVCVCEAVQLISHPSHYWPAVEDILTLTHRLIFKGILQIKMKDLSPFTLLYCPLFCFLLWTKIEMFRMSRMLFSQQWNWRMTGSVKR